MIKPRFLHDAVLLLALTTPACSSGGSPPPPPPPPSPAGDMSTNGSPDLSAVPRIVSVVPGSVPRNATTTITVKGYGLGLDQSQPGIWDFGACTIGSYTYVPVDPDTCKIDLQVGALNAGTSCDLTLSKNGKPLASLKAAFTISP
jgi:hypothetical protein